ncbi:HNH endonuclease signature motif containing protein, partial [Pseudonocardia autotrophica]
MPRIRTIERWFVRHIQEDADGCWIWTGSKMGNGYGQVRVQGCSSAAHRAIYEYLIAPVPAGLDLDHLCRKRACVNPYHLEPVTRSVNLRRGNTRRLHNSSKTACPN